MTIGNFMKVILAMVMSVDGKTTKWHNPHLHTWTSQEDQQYFSGLIEKHNLIIMGRKTYEAAKSLIKHKPGKLRIVITNNPQQFNNVAIPEQLEFTSVQPKTIIKQLEDRGYTNAFLVGGEHTNSLFLQDNLVNELWVTIEPKIFGSGNGLVGNENFDLNVGLFSI